MDLLDNGEKETIEQSLENHHKRRKITEFHRNLFDQNDDDLKKFSQVFNSNYNQIVIRLPYGQIVQIWKVFISKLSSDNVCGGELFASFLDHVRIADETTPSTLLVQEEQLIEQTKNVLIDYYDEGQSSLATFLKMVLSFGNLILLKLNYSLAKKHKLDKERLKSVFDLYPIHDYINEELWTKIFESSFKQKNLEVSILAFKVLLQKLSVIMIYQQSATKPKRAKMYLTVFCQLFDQLLEMVDNKPYLVIHLIPYIPILPKSSLPQIATIIQEELLANKSQDGESLIKSVRECLQESTSFQSAFLLSVIIRVNGLCQNKVIKSIIDGYKSDTESSEFNDETKNQHYEDICKVLADQTFDSTITISSNYDTLSALLDNLSLLPLDCLQPKSQLECSLFLTIFLFSSSSSGKKWKNILAQVVDCLIQIIGGVRYVWMFKYINSVDYISILLSKSTHNKVQLIPDNFQKLMSLVIERSFKEHNLTFNSLKSLHKFVKKKLEHPEMNLFFSTILLNEVNDRLSRIKKGQNYAKDEDDAANNKVCQDIKDDYCNRLFDSLSTQLESNLDPFNDLTTKAFISLVNHKLVNSSFTSIQENHLKEIIQKAFNQFLSSFSSNLDENVQPIMQFLVHLLSRHKDLTNLLPENFALKILDHLVKNIMIGQNLTKSSTINNQLSDIKSEQDFSTSNNTFQSNANLLKKITDEIFRLITESEMELHVNQIGQLINDYRLSEENFSYGVYLLEGLFTSDWSSSWSNKSTDYEGKKQLMTNQLVDQLIANLHLSLVNKYYLSTNSFTKLVTIIGFMKKILRNGKLFITAPRLYACFQCLLLKPLNLITLNPDQFFIIFQSMLNFIHEVVTNYEYIYGSCKVFIKDLLYALLSALITLSDQVKFGQFSAQIRQDIIRSASEYHRLICQVTSVKETFASEAPHLIVFYLVSSHRVTISPLVKSQLILAIYRLLNIIKSQSNWSNIYETIHCRLDESGREILKDLFENYEKYYIFKGRF